MLSIAFSVIPLACEAAVISGPVVNPSTGNAYYLLSSSSWSASEAEAQSLGGHLATINDANEDMWIYDTFATPTRMLWLGLNDVTTDGQFAWASGEPLVYTNWSAGEPQGGLAENWVAVRTEAIGPPREWIDYIDSGDFFGIPIHGVVEVQVPEPSTIALLPAVGVCSLIAGYIQRPRRKN